MRYLCLVYSVEDPVDALTENEEQALIDESLEYDEQLRESGHFITANALKPPESGAIVHVRSGRISVTDGPFAETKEQVAGFVLIEARDLNEAIQVASKIPPARYGFVEVRPIRELVRSAAKHVT
jgi:hypothetical protein